MTRLTLAQVRRLDDPKVAILPTAAPRQVQQPCNKAGRAARAEIREGSPFPNRYVSPQMRRARERAAIMQEVPHTAELFVLLAILETIPREQRQAMVERLALPAVAGGAPRQALEVIRSTLLCLGEALDLQRAQAELRGERH